MSELTDLVRRLRTRLRNELGGWPSGSADQQEAERLEAADAISRLIELERRVKEAPVGTVAYIPVGQDVIEVAVRLSAHEACVWNEGKRVRLLVVEE